MRTVVAGTRTLVLALALLGSVSLAQGTSVITGTVTDASTERPLANVLVTARSPALQGAATDVSDAAGHFHLLQLPGGEYELTVEKEAYRPFARREVPLRLDRTVRLNVQLQPEAVQGEVLVIEAQPATLDVGSTTTGLVVGRDVINHLAFTQPTEYGVRSFGSLAAVAPQATPDLYGFGLSGAQSAENLYLLDGMPVNDPAYGVLAAVLPVDFIQEADVMTGGYPAEYGRGFGGVVNAVSKSGSNEFHGSVFANETPGVLSPWYQPVGVLGRSVSQTSKTWNLIDLGAELGGPLVKDRLWFYVGLSPVFHRRRATQTVSALQVDHVGELDPSTGASLEAYRTDAQGNWLATPIPGAEQHHFEDLRTLSYIAKLTWLVDPDHTLTAEVNGGAGDRTQPSFSSLASGRVFTQASNTVSVRYRGAFLEKHLLLDATVGWFEATYTPTGLPDDGSTLGSTSGWASVPQVLLQQSDPALSITALQPFPASVVQACARPAGARLEPCPTTGLGSYAIGGPGPMVLAHDDRLVARGAATWLFSALGHHVLKAGVELERTTYHVAKAVSGGATITVSADGTRFTAQGYGALVGPDQVAPVASLERTVGSTQVGGFVQDSWSVLDVVTVNLGLRYDAQYLEDGQGRVGLALATMLSPRLGVVYDFTGQGRSRLFASYGRYHELLPLVVADLALAGDSQVLSSHRASCLANPLDPLAYLASACSGPASAVLRGADTDPNRFARAYAAGTTTVDPGLQPASRDELVLGAEYEPLPGLRAGVTYTRSWLNLIIEDMSNDQTASFFLGNPGVGMADAERTGVPRATRDYDGLTLHASQAFRDGWLAQASYTLSWLRGNYAGYIRPESYVLSPGTNAAFDLRTALANLTGDLPGDRRHHLKAHAAKEFALATAWTLLVGLSYEGNSGTPISYLGSAPAYGANQIYLLPRGTAGRTPWVHTLSVKAGLGYRLGPDLGLQVTVDALNVAQLGVAEDGSVSFPAATLVDQSYTLPGVYPLPYTGPDGLEALCVGARAACVPRVRTVDENNRPLGTLTRAQLNPSFGKAQNFERPLEVRFGLKFTF